jgi:hypothetical protein
MPVLFILSHLNLYLSLLTRRRVIAVRFPAINNQPGLEVVAYGLGLAPLSPV